jgi:conjugal transfer pilus assembly protein TraF
MTGTNQIIKFLVLVLLVNASVQVSAAPAVGWHWYNEIIESKDKNKKLKPAKKLHEVTAQEQMLQLRQTVEEAKARAILFPSEENVHTYLQLQNYVVAKAAIFSRVWKKTLLDYPDVDYAISHPTENNAQHVMYAEEDARENQAIAALSDKYGLFFFYRGNNLLDQELAPTIAGFAREYHVALIPVAVDGKILAVFPGSRNDSGQAAKLGITYFPALVLVDPASQEVKPLNYGFIAQDELKRRFLQVATDFKEGT